MDTTPETYLKEVLACISDIKLNIGSSNDWNHQNRSTFLKGFFLRHKSNTLIPLSSIKHRVQFECHEQFVLEGYIKLANGVMDRLEDPLALFTLRVLHEIGFDKINVLFAEQVSSIEKEEFKLFDSLSDLLGMSGDEYASNFLSLLNDEREKLNTKMKELFEEAEAKIKKAETITPSLLKKIRRHANSRVGDFSKKVPLPKLLENKTSFEFLNITLSHLLHGNPITIRVTMDPAFYSRHKNWILATLWNTGLNILIRTKPVITDAALKNKIEKLILQAESIWKELLKRRIKQ